MSIGCRRPRSEQSQEQAVPMFSRFQLARGRGQREFGQPLGNQFPSARHASGLPPPWALGAKDYCFANFGPPQFDGRHDLVPWHELFPVTND